MYSKNHKYVNDKLLKEWLKNNNFTKERECLVQFFSGIAEEKVMQDIGSIISKNLPNAHVLGTTTDGEICSDNVSENEIIISVTIFEKSTLSSVLLQKGNSAFDLGERIALALEDEDIKVMILLTSGLNINGENFLEGVKKVSEGKYIVSGGMAGDNAKFVKTFISHGSTVISDGCVGVVIKGKELKVKNNYKFGWDAVGLPMKVTKSEENRVYELDNTPIINIYKKYFGKHISNLIPDIGIEIPLIINRNEIKIARACIYKFDDNSLLFAGNIKENEEVRFGIGNAEIVVKDSHLIYQEIQDSFTPESIFIYSCMARRRLLGSQSAIELQSISKNCSVSGFFTYGEFYSDESSTYLFNETMTMLAMSESNIKTEKEIDSSEVIIENRDTTMICAITHMTNVIAQEWQEKLNVEVEKNKEHERQSFQKNKLAQMGEMIGMIAHQWRQPLNAISATGINLSLLSSMGMLEEEKVQESSEFIQEQCQKMSGTIDTFINFVKPAKESKGFKLAHTVDSIMQIMGTQLSNHNIKVKIESTNENISIVGYEDLLEQVIINILSNARDAFEEIEQAEKYINITIDIKNNIPIINIEDNAGGVPKEIVDQIFNPYFTTKEQGKGTGIGLYMSMDIMKKSFGGDLVYRATDSGSCFSLVCGGGR